jgi:ethanolamine utilization microcompartment shell protein EutS
MIDLRSYVLLDSLQPQHAAFLGTVAKGFLPVAGQASLFIEVSPGIAINRLTDIAVKATDVKPGQQIVERLYGLLEIHHGDQGQVRRAGQAILAEIGKQETDRLKPELLTSQVVRHLDDRQTQLINRVRHGHMIVAGDSLYVLECAPAANAALAANEAEKAAHIKVLEIVTFGSFGRVYLAGEDRDIDVAWPAAEQAILALGGRAK